MHSRRLAAPLALALGVVARADAQITTRVSVDSSAAQADARSNWPVVSRDGRFIAFESTATNLIPGDANGLQDIFRHDRATGATVRLSVSSSGTEATGPSAQPTISVDGRFVAFQSLASNLVAGDTNSRQDVFVHDCATGETVRVSVGPGGVEANGDSLHSSISADGQVIAFDSTASNLVPGDTNGSTDVFVHARSVGTTLRASVDTSGAQANRQSQIPFLSANGKVVTFMSHATNLVPTDRNGIDDAFVHDLTTGVTELASLSTSGEQGNGESGARGISLDGRYVLFISHASNLGSGPDQNGNMTDLFVRDRVVGLTVLASVSSGGEQADKASGEFGASFSDDARFIAFDSSATNLVANDTNGQHDVFRRDLVTGVTLRVSVDDQGGQGDGPSGERHVTISADGRCVVFDASATDLVTGDTNGVRDVFVHGEELTIGIEPAVAVSGQPLAITLFGGSAARAAALCVVELEHRPFFVLVQSRWFDEHGALIVAGIVPPGFGALTATFRGVGFSRFGWVVSSNELSIDFQ